jgi:hypothetical protein
MGEGVMPVVKKVKLMKLLKEKVTPPSWTLRTVGEQLYACKGEWCT